MADQETKKRIADLHDILHKRKGIYSERYHNVSLTQKSDIYGFNRPQKEVRLLEFREVPLYSFWKRVHAWRELKRIYRQTSDKSVREIIRQELRDSGFRGWLHRHVLV